MSLTRATSTNAVEILVGRGFTLEAAKYALAIYNDDVTLAQAWLDDPKNEETLGKIDTATPGEGSPDMTAEDDAGDLVLLNLTETPGADSVLHRIAVAMGRLEDLSQSNWRGKAPKQ